MLFEIQRILSLFLLKQLQQRDQPSLIHSSRCNRIIENGGKLFINPGFINSKYNEHNKRLKKRFLYLDKLRRFNTLRKDPFNL